MEPRREDHQFEKQQNELRRDLDAAVQTRKELGPEYESEIVDSFLSRLDSRLDAQVDRRVAEQLDRYGPDDREGRRPERRGSRGHGWGGANRLPIISLFAAIPLSGVAGGTGGVTGLIVAWGGIVGVNFASAYAERREAREHQERQSSRTRSEWA